MKTELEAQNTTGEEFPRGIFDHWVGQALRLDAKSLCADARRKTGLDTFGDPPLEPALSVLVESLECEAELHPLGRFLMRVHLQDLLASRLKLVAQCQGRAREVEKSSPVAPIFIVGMPRSGSTFLHELLARDEALRAPRFWEVMSPEHAMEADRG